MVTVRQSSSSPNTVRILDRKQISDCVRIIAARWLDTRSVTFRFSCILIKISLFVYNDYCIWPIYNMYTLFAVAADRCVGGMEWTDCGVHCTPTCWDRNPHPCPSHCTPRCACPQSRPLWDDVMETCTDAINCPVHRKKGTGSLHLLHCYTPG